jgi:O-antigen/teichoic acid export membrane protein
MAFVHAYAIQLITLCFNEKWLPAADVLRVLAICGMIQSVFSPCSLIFLSTGRSDLQFRIGVHGVIGTIISVALGLQYGMVGVAYAYTIFNAFWFASISRTIAQLLKCRISSFLTPLASSFLGFCVILFLANVINQFGCLNQTGKALVVFLCVPIVSGLLLFKNKILIYKNRRIRFHKNEQ